MLKQNSYSPSRESARSTVIYGTGKKIGSTNTTIRAANGLDDDIFKFAGDPASGEIITRFQMFNVTVLGNAENQTAGSCIAAPFFGSTFERCHIENGHRCGLWLQAVSGRSTDNNRVQYCTLKKSNVNLMNGLFLADDGTLKYKASGSQYYGPYNSIHSPHARSDGDSTYRGPVNIWTRGDNVNIFRNHLFDVDEEAETFIFHSAGQKIHIQGNHIDGNNPDTVGIDLTSGGKDQIFMHVKDNTFVDEFDAAVQIDPGQTTDSKGNTLQLGFKHSWIEGNGFGSALSGTTENFTTAIRLEEGDSDSYRGTKIQNNAFTGNYDNSKIEGIDNGAIVKQNSNGPSAQDVRNISVPSKWTLAVHDGSGGNTSGPAFYNGSNWKSIVDGTEIT